MVEPANSIEIRDSHLVETDTYHQNTQNNTIFGPGHQVQLGVFQNYFGSKPNEAEPLLSQVLPSAIHDSEARTRAPRCHLGTRISLLQKVEDLAQDAPSSPLTRRCLWISGPAGSGKSAIVQTAAERLHKQGRLAASFFLPPADAVCNVKEAIIPTLAHQLCRWCPQILPRVTQVINNQLIFTKSLASQLDQLITNPLREACKREPSLNDTFGVIVLDGLDQCRDQRELILLFVEAFSRNFLPLILLITTSLEPHIIEIFDSIHPSHPIVQVALDDALAPSTDVELYVRSALDQVKGGRSHPIHEPWLPEDSIQKVLQKSSGQFLYASAVVEYICLPGGDPHQRLQEILSGTFPEGVSPFQEMDKRFMRILRSVNPDSLDIVMDILACLVVYDEGDIGSILPISGGVYPLLPSSAGLKKLLMISSRELHERLSSLHSLFEIPPNITGHVPLRVFHPSFWDFLADPSRAGPFTMTIEAASARIAKCLLRHLLVQRTFTGSKSGPLKALYNSEVLEESFRHHLCRAPPTRELRKIIEEVAGLSKGNQEALKYLNLGRLPSASLLPFASLSCGTKQAIVTFLQECNNANNKSSIVRRLIIRNRLTMFRFRNVFMASSCGRQSCSCLRP